MTSAVVTRAGRASVLLKGFLQLTDCTRVPGWGRQGIAKADGRVQPRFSRERIAFPELSQCHAERTRRCPNHRCASRHSSSSTWTARSWAGSRPSRWRRRGGRTRPIGRGVPGTVRHPADRPAAALDGAAYLPGRRRHVPGRGHGRRRDGGRRRDPALDGSLDEQPLRLPWARSAGRQRTWPGPTKRSSPRGSAADRRCGADADLEPVERLAMPTSAGAAWLKVVPPFFAHEGASWAAWPAGPCPHCSGHDGPRC